MTDCYIVTDCYTVTDGYTELHLEVGHIDRQLQLVQHIESVLDGGRIHLAVEDRLHADGADRDAHVRQAVDEVVVGLGLRERESRED